LAVARPAKLGAQDRKAAGDRQFLALRSRHGIRDRPHQAETPEGEGPLALKALDALGRLATVRRLGGGSFIRRGFESLKEWRNRAHRRAPSEAGGREWESNPPRTVSRPFPDLKSGRPTRDVSPPAWLENMSVRLGLMRRQSPRRRVKPWRSKYSRIWIATLRPFSSRSRNSAAPNRPPSAPFAMSIAIRAISATAPAKKK